MFTTSEKNYRFLLSLLPNCVYMYFGCNDEGNTERRFSIVDQVAEVKDEEEEEPDSEEERKKEEAARFWAAKKEAERLYAEQEKARAGEEKRRLIEAGLVEGNVRTQGKQEIATKKDKQGKRMAKTGQKKSVFMGPGSAYDLLC